MPVRSAATTACRCSICPSSIPPACDPMTNYSAWVTPALTLRQASVAWPVARSGRRWPTTTQPRHSAAEGGRDLDRDLLAELGDGVVEVERSRDVAALDADRHVDRHARRARPAGVID